MIVNVKFSFYEQIDANNDILYTLTSYFQVVLVVEPYIYIPG